MILMISRISEDSEVFADLQGFADLMVSEDFEDFRISRIFRIPEDSEDVDDFQDS